MSIITFIFFQPHKQTAVIRHHVVLYVPIIKPSMPSSQPANSGKQIENRIRVYHNHWCATVNHVFSKNQSKSVQTLKKWYMSAMLQVIIHHAVVANVLVLIIHWQFWLKNTLNHLELTYWNRSLRIFVIFNIHHIESGLLHIFLPLESDSINTCFTMLISNFSY